MKRSEIESLLPSVVQRAIRPHSPLSAILDKTATALDGINRIINSPETRHTLQTLDDSVRQN